MKNLLAAVFLIALLAWAWLEFFVPTASEGVKDILFWIGMLAVLLPILEADAQARKDRSNPLQA